MSGWSVSPWASSRDPTLGKQKIDRRSLRFCQGFVVFYFYTLFAFVFPFRYVIRPPLVGPDALEHSLFPFIGPMLAICGSQHWFAWWLCRFQRRMLSCTQNLWLLGRRLFNCFLRRLHELNTSLILVLTCLNLLTSLRVCLHFLHLWLALWNSSTMKCLIFLNLFFFFFFFLLLHRCVAVNMGFKVAGIIMDDRIGLRQFHGCLHHLHFVRQTSIDNVFFGGKDQAALRIDDELPSRSRVLHRNSLLPLVRTSASAFILNVFFSWPPFASNSARAFSPLKPKRPSKLKTLTTLEGSKMFEGHRRRCERDEACWAVYWERGHHIWSSLCQGVPSKALVKCPWLDDVLERALTHGTNAGFLTWRKLATHKPRVAHLQVWSRNPWWPCRLSCLLTHGRTYTVLT